MRATPQIITSAMQLYFTGESFKNVKRFIELQGIKMSRMYKNMYNLYIFISMFTCIPCKHFLYFSKHVYFFTL
jgi:hypothetical protein